MKGERKGKRKGQRKGKRKGLVWHSECCKCSREGQKSSRKAKFMWKSAKIIKHMPPKPLDSFYV